MKFLFLLSLLYIFVAACRAGTAEGVFKDPKHPGKCVVGDLILSPNEVVQQSPFCGRIICSEDGWVDFHDCGVQIPREGYKLGNPNLPDAPYPDCCEREEIPIN